jgi:hypothetical protein
LSGRRVCPTGDRSDLEFSEADISVGNVGAVDPIIAVGMGVIERSADRVGEYGVVIAWSCKA